MKTITIAASTILVAFALYASEPTPQPKTGPKSQPAPLVTTVLSASEAGSIGDSPLVRAAKAGHRTGLKSSTVITNETLVRTGGHFITTDAQRPIAPVHASPTSAEVQWLSDRRKAANDSATAAAAALKTEQQKRLDAARTAQVMDGDTPEALYSSEPPPVDRGPVQTMKPAAPNTMQEKQKPPL